MADKTITVAELKIEGHCRQGARVNLLRITSSYDLGLHRGRRGVYLSISPCFEYEGYVRSLMGSGNRDILREMKRYSKKQHELLVANLLHNPEWKANLSKQIDLVARGHFTFDPNQDFKGIKIPQDLMTAVMQEG